MADDYSTVLWNEFSEQEGSFMLQMRVDLTWDKAAFTRLTEAMLVCCKAYDAVDRRAAGIGVGADPHGIWADRTCLPRWIAEGFWYVSWFVRDWTTHPAWAERTKPEQEYYDRAYERLFDLAWWFFTGDSPYENPDRAFAPM